MSFVTALREGTWLNRSRVTAYPLIFLSMFLIINIAWFSGLYKAGNPNAGLMLTDFINVYVAGTAVHDGVPERAYNWPEQKTREDQIIAAANKGKILEKDNGCIPWLYPPMFLGIAWLVAFLPYFTALGIYSLAGLVAYGAMLRKLAPQVKEALWPVVAFPGVYINLMSGQNGFITTVLLAAGLYFLDQTPIIAGAAFGILSYKPHFFILIPFVLLIGRYWKALAATIISAAVCTALSFFAFGLASWVAFYNGIGDTGRLLEMTSDRWLGFLHSVFSMVRALGGGVQTAYTAQVLVAGCAVLVLAWVWSRGDVSLAVRGTSLVVAALLVSPYSFAYDQVLLAIPIALLVRQGLQNGFLSYEKTFLFALWLLPFFVQDSGKHFVLSLTPPMLIGTMILCWKRTRGELHTIRPQVFLDRTET